MRSRLPALVFAFTLVAPAGAADAPALPPIAPVPGPLVIVGGGAVPADARRAVFDLAGREKARLVVIPTAGDSADAPAAADGFVKGWRALQPASVVLLHTRDRKTADDPAFVKPLTEATGVWFGGGDQSKIVAAYRGTLVEKELMKLHRRGGVIGGSSAGAAVMSDPMITGGMGTDVRSGSGLGYLPGVVVDQHFTQRKRAPRLAAFVDQHPGVVGLGIDEATAVVVRGREIKVIGAGAVTVRLAAGAGKPAASEVTKTGGTLDLMQLRRAAANRAATEPFPPAKVSDPVVEKGSLVIVGGGGAGPEIWKRFITLAGGNDAPIVVVPTALEDPLPATITEVQALKRAGATNVTVLHTRDRATADNPDFSTELLTARGVWFGGGRQWRFVDAYAGTLAEKRFHGVLARGGVIGGSSAGASIQSEYMPRGHPLGNTTVMAEGYERGFGFLPGAAVDQHFFARKRTADMTGLMAAYPQYLGIGIDEGTAIVVTGHTAEVIGRTKVAFYDRRAGQPKAGEKDYTEVPAGGVYDLKARAVK